MSTAPNEFTAHYCGKCGSWHQGSLCAHERTPQAPTTIVVQGTVSEWQVCPICDGCGTVPHDFYTRLGVATTTTREKCRRCDATGTIARPTND